MADHERGRDVVETVSIATDTSASERDGFRTPLSMPASDASGAATPKATDLDEAGGSYFKNTDAEQTPKVERVRTAEKLHPAAVATKEPTQGNKELESSARSQPSDTGSEEKQGQDVDIERGEKAPSEKLGDHDLTLVESAPHDPNIVNWDGPNDPAKGTNWKASKKWGIVATLSCLTFIS
jgi:hypothetical protein